MRPGTDTPRPGSRWYVAWPLSCMAVIYLLSAIPGDIDPTRHEAYRVMLWVPPSVQNLLHLPVYGALAWLWCRALQGWGLSGGKLFALALTVTALYGAFDEWHQLYVPGRYVSALDLGFNLLGALLGVAVFQRQSHAGWQQQKGHLRGRASFFRSAD